MITHTDKVCCQLSILAYRSQDILHKSFIQDFDKPRCHSSDIDAQCITTISDGVFYIAFRGTESIRDWLSDANTIRVPMDLPSIVDEKRPKVHWGFLRQFRSLQEHIVNDILDYLINCRGIPKIVITGHSLGAAQASLAALYFSLFYPLIDVYCYTFGSPRVGHSRFVHLFKKHVHDHKRFVNEDDPVTMIPFATRFIHLPNMYHIDKYNIISHKKEGRWVTMIRDLFLSICGRENPIDDHDCQHYKRKLIQNSLPL